MSHWLVVHEQGEDYDIEHEENCPTEKWMDDLNGVPIKFHTCLIGALINDLGLDALDIDWYQLLPGRYEIEGWSEKHGAIPGIRDVEWSAGIQLVSA